MIEVVGEEEGVVPLLIVVGMEVVVVVVAGPQAAHSDADLHLESRLQPKKLVLSTH